MSTSKGGLIFISCGQVTAQEKKLGNDVADLVRNLTPHEPYFAEQQGSLEAFTKYILGNLDRAVALIAIIHPRGTVRFTDEQGIVREHVRASVWIEQELAISAYITQIRSIPLTVKAYVKSGVAREGMRDKLPLNPVEFKEDSEVLRDLTNILPGWKDIPASLKVSGPPKVRVRLVSGIASNFILRFFNDTQEHVFISDVKLKWEGKLLMEPWKPVLPTLWRVPANGDRAIDKRLYEGNPATSLVRWNDHKGLFFQTDIDVVFDCEMLGQVREVQETLRVKVSAVDNSLVQL